MKYIYIKSILLSVILFGFLGVMNAQNARVTITSPNNIAGEYDAQLAGFIECEFQNISGTLALGEDDFGTATACNAAGDLSDVSNAVNGNIALMDRGNCAFTDKVFAAQQAGAIAVIVCNNDDDGLLTMSGEDDQINIPSVFMAKADCDVIRASLDDNIELSIERIGVQDDFPDDEVIWGDRGEGSFDGGLGDWESVGISDGSHNWGWSEDGTGQGVLFSGPVASPTMCNGTAIFDFDFIQTGGLEENLPTGTPPTIVGELISPSIDLSGIQAVAVKFYQHNVPLNGTNQVATSIDGGVTWSEGIDITTENVLTASENNLIGTELVRIPLPDVAGESDVKIKFIADGDFYFWSIDDVTLVELTGNNITIADAFYTPIAYGFPQAHADADTFFFFATVRNTGGSILDNVRLDVSVMSEDTGEEVFATSGTREGIAIGETTTVEGDNLFVPVGLPIGKYVMQYDLSVLDASETVRNDNSSTKIFEVTEDIFSKEPGPLDNGFYGASRPGGEWSAAAVYRMSKNVTDYFATNAITSITSNADVLTDNFVDVFLVQLNEGIDFTNFDFQETDLAGHPSFNIISQNTHVFTSEENGELISVPFSSSGQSVPLEPGETYMVILRFDGTQAGSAAVPNEELFLSYNNDPRVANILDDVGFISDFVVSNDQGQWFSGFSGDPAPVIRMQVEFMSDVDDIPLPAGSFSVYPNPARDLLQVEFDFEETTDATIVLASMEGKIVQVRTLNNVSKRNIQLDVANLPAGTYVLKAYTDNGSSTEKIIIAE